MRKLSIIIPVCNKEQTTNAFLAKIEEVKLNNTIEKEVIVVNVSSGTVPAAIQKASGDFIMIAEPGTEVDDLNSLLQPLLDGEADVVYGSRFIHKKVHSVPFFWNKVGNKILSFLSGLFTNIAITDIISPCKVFKADVVKSLELREKGASLDAELSAKISAIPGIRIYEVAVRSDPEKEEGLHWKESLRAIVSIFKYNLFANSKTFQPSYSLFSNRLVYLVMLVFFLAGTVLIFLAEGTGDEGDSIMHYLYAKHSWQNPEFFFYQWAKPLFVLIASPFTQFGMAGMKFFNLVVSTLTIYFTFLTARKLLLSNAWLVALCMAFAPWMMIITLSGLTEPLFALWMIIGIYLIISKRYVAGIVWLSFLPFVRSEGLIILSVLLMYLISKRFFKYIPLLLVGHAFYSIAGYFYHHDFLWVFNTLSYATLNSVYGKGKVLHFVFHLPEVLGKPVCSFLVVGLIYGLLKTIDRFYFKQKQAFTNEEFYLVFGMFTAYFVGHSAFWALGIFNSFGLWRVMIGILPLIAIIAVRGFNMVASITKHNFIRPILYLCIALIIIYPFLGRLYSFNWTRDFSLKADQVAENRMGDYVKKNFPDYKQHLFFYEACYISVALDLNYFDTTQHKNLYGAFAENRFPKGSFIVWDDWFATVQGGVEEAQLLNDPRFELVKGFEEQDVWGRTRKVRLFKVK